MHHHLVHYFFSVFQVMLDGEYGQDSPLLPQVIGGQIFFQAVKICIPQGNMHHCRAMAVIPANCLGTATASK